MSQRHIVPLVIDPWPFKKLKGREGQVTTHTQQQDPGSGCFFDGNNKTWEQNLQQRSPVLHLLPLLSSCSMLQWHLHVIASCCSHRNTWDMILWAEELIIYRGGVLVTWIRQAMITKDILIPYSRHMYRCRHSLHDSITQYLLSVVLPIYSAELSVRTKYQCSHDTQFPWQCSPAECCRSAEPVPAQGAAANFLQSHRRGAPALSCIMLQFRE